MTAMWDRDLGLAERLAQEGVAICREVGDARSIGRALYAAGDIAGWWAFDSRRAVTLLEEGTIFARETDDQQLPWMLGALATVKQALGESDRARELLEEGLAVARRHEDLACVGASLMDLARSSADSWDYSRAKELLEKSVDCLGEVGDRMGLASAKWHLGEVLRCQGDCSGARSALGESLTLFERTGLPPMIATVRLNLGLVALQEGDHEEARAQFEGSVGTVAERGRRVLALWLLAFGLLASRRNDQARAVRLLKAAATHEFASLIHTYPADRAAFDLALAQARAALGEEAFARALAEGQAMSFEQAVEYALT
jgi:hypothetical protein